MEILSGAEMVVRSLINQGIKHIFGYPGGAVLDLSLIHISEPTQSLIHISEPTRL
jgi:hypothetical protein